MSCVIRTVASAQCGPITHRLRSSIVVSYNRRSLPPKIILTSHADAFRRRGDPPARPAAASRGRTFPRDLPRPPHRPRQTRGLDRDLFPVGARRALALAQDRCRRGVALPRGRAAVLEIASTEHGPVERLTLGPDLAAGERPQAIVQAHQWQAAEARGDWTLVGCTVAPGFEFAGFERAPRDWKPG